MRRNTSRDSRSPAVGSKDPHLSSRMLRIQLATSGEEAVALNAGDLEAVVEQYGSTVASLKRYLAQRHFPRRFSRFQLRILREGDSVEMKDEESITPPLDLQLILMNHLPPDEERDASFVESCGEGRVDEVVESLIAPQNPNVVSNGETALTCAATHGRQEIVRFLLEAGADTEWRLDFQRTALHEAALNGHTEVVRDLLNFGADMESTDFLCWSPLHLAAFAAHAAIVQLLLDSGAGKDAEDRDGRRPLHFAAAKGYQDIVQSLLHSSADKEAEDPDGKRPLHLAAREGQLDVVILLLKAGAEKDALDRGGVTASGLAIENCHFVVAHLLQEDMRRRLSCKSAE